VAAKKDRDNKPDPKTEDVTETGQAEVSAAEADRVEDITDNEDLTSEAETITQDDAPLEAKAAAESQTAANAAILSQLHGQLDSGQSYESLLADLKAGGVTIPDALSAPAENGVASISTLQAEFTPAARTALADARDADKRTGLIAFLQRQTNARSVSPKDGDDPDAVLSRAEAALGAGDLASALEELRALPQSAQAALADWEKAAQTRLSAMQAADALAQSVNSN